MAKKAARRATEAARKSATALRILIVEARLLRAHRRRAAAGATRVLDEAGAAYDRITVPGALEIPAAIAIAIDAAQRKRAPYDGVVALGCVIQGETYHFEIVSNEVGARPDGSVGARAAADRQRHSHRRHRGAGARARQRRRGATRAATPRAPRSRMVRAQAHAGRQVMAPRAPRDDKDARKANKRGAARLAAVQALYQMDLAGTGLNEILAEFESHWIGREVEGAQYLPAEAAFFRDIVSGVVREQRELDPLIDEALAKAGRSSASRRCCARCCAPAPTSSTTAATCRRASWSSEYADVAAAFVERDETGMVNAVLDQLAREFRAADEFDRLAEVNAMADARR